MADTNTYVSKQKVEKWTTREKFNALDLSTIETGTEYNLTGAIEESELDAALQTKINGKLTKPTNPSAESAVTMLADGTVGTKLLSEIGGGGKLYLHRISIYDDSYTYSAELYVIASTADSIVNEINNYNSRFINGFYYGENTTKVYTIISYGARAGRDINFRYINADNVETIIERPFSEIKSDTATEL